MNTFQAQTNFLRDKTILITGASDGIGREAAKTYASFGASVILLGRNVKKLEQIYDEIMQAGYPQPAIYPLDLLKASPEDYSELAKRIESEFGKLDGLLHNAAVLGSLTPLEHYPVKQWYEVMQTNLNAPYLITHYLLPLLKRADKASIIFTTANVGHQGKAYWGAYSVSKFGLEGFMQILADELENTHVRVNCINPGNVRTKLRAAAYPAEDPKQLTDAKTIMPAYLYLMAEDSSMVNGEYVAAQQ